MRLKKENFGECNVLIIAIVKGTLTGKDTFNAFKIFATLYNVRFYNKLQRITLRDSVLRLDFELDFAEIGFESSTLSLALSRKILGGEIRQLKALITIQWAATSFCLSL